MEICYSYNFFQKRVIYELGIVISIKFALCVLGKNKIKSVLRGIGHVEVGSNF